MSNPLKNTEPIRKRNRMGLRDWKRVQRGKYGELWQNKKTEMYVALVYKPEIKYFESGDENNNILYEKEFKTKFQVINYGMKFMRNH